LDLTEHGPHGLEQKPPRARGTGRVPVVVCDAAAAGKTARPLISQGQGSIKRPAATLRRVDPALRSPKPIPPTPATPTAKSSSISAEPNSAKTAHAPHLTPEEIEYAARFREEMDKPDDRLVCTAYAPFDEDDAELPPIISAAPGFMLLVIHTDRKGRVEGYGSHHIIAWKMCHGGSSPLPLSFSTDVRYDRMCECAVMDPSGKVRSFEDFSYPSAAAWLRDRKRELGRRT
jgi:hypothetical protein